MSILAHNNSATRPPLGAGTLILSSFSVVRHADHLAEQLREPYGTLILTLAVTSIEVMMISAPSGVTTGASTVTVTVNYTFDNNGQTVTRTASQTQ